MMPVAPTAKRSNGFSIESLMGKDPPRSSSSTAPISPDKPSPAVRSPVPAREPGSIGGVGSSFHPVHPGAGALLNGLKGLYHHHQHGPPPPGLPEGAFPEGLHPLGLPVTSLPHGGPCGPLPQGLMTGMHHHPGMPHPLLLGAQRDPFSLYPWLLSRHGAVFGHHRIPGK